MIKKKPKQSTRGLANLITSQLSIAEDRYNQENKAGGGSEIEMEKKIRAV